MNRGYIKIWRKIEDSGLYQMPETLALFMFLLTKATHKPRRIGCLLLARGQYSSGRIELARILKQSEQTIRTGLDRLKKLEILTIESTKHGSVYTVVNYNNYQDNEEQSTIQLTNEQPTANQQLTNEQPTANHITNTETHNTETHKQNTLAIGGAELPSCPHQEIIALYHEILPELSAVKDWTEKRRKNLQSRWREDANRQSLDYWKRFFSFVSKSDFLMGRKTEFRADLEWLVNSSNFVKVIEGKYARSE